MILRAIAFILLCTACTSALLIHQNVATYEDKIQSLECPSDDTLCKEDRLGFEAIYHLHHQIDDDNNGNLDRSESDDFIRGELKHEDTASRHIRFHGNDDQISVEDLWFSWINSQVYNWTVDDTLEWLVSHVDLPQYVEVFRVNDVDGHALPRIAANAQYVSNVLGLKNVVHKQKLALKAMDAVLFGAPKTHNYMKDLMLVTSLVVALGGCWLAYMQHRYSQSKVKKLLSDMENLQNAESALDALKEKLDNAEQEQIQMQQEKKNLEIRMESDMKQAKVEAERLRGVRDTTTEEISRLRLAEEELIQVRHALEQAEKRMETKQGMPQDLQPWLQLTYEIERKYFNDKREAVEKSLHQARDMCERIRKKRSSFMGSVRIAHSTSINETDLAILNASAAAEKIRADLKEHKDRWSQIQRICDFNIELNPGMDYLHMHLHGKSSSIRKAFDESDEHAAGYSTPGAVSSPSEASLSGVMPASFRISPTSPFASPSSSLPPDYPGLTAVNKADAITSSTSAAHIVGLSPRTDSPITVTHPSAKQSNLMESTPSPANITCATSPTSQYSKVDFHLGNATSQLDQPAPSYDSLGIDSSLLLRERSNSANASHDLTTTTSVAMSSGSSSTSSRDCGNKAGNMNKRLPRPQTLPSALSDTQLPEKRAIVSPIASYIEEVGHDSSDGASSVASSAALEVSEKKKKKGSGLFSKITKRKQTSSDKLKST